MEGILQTYAILLFPCEVAIGNDPTIVRAYCTIKDQICSMLNNILKSKALLILIGTLSVCLYTCLFVSSSYALLAETGISIETKCGGKLGSMNCHTYSVELKGRSKNMQKRCVYFFAVYSHDRYQMKHLDQYFRSRTQFCK